MRPSMRVGAQFREATDRAVGRRVNISHFMSGDELFTALLPATYCNTHLVRLSVEHGGDLLRCDALPQFAVHAHAKLVQFGFHL